MFRFTSEWEPAPRDSPEGQTLLAVGDVHGCLEAFEEMLAVLAVVVERARGRGRACRLVMLGDYVDRGPDSPGVLRRLLTLDRCFGADVPVQLLRGNHDQMLLDHLRVMPHPGTFELWLMNGGSSVLAQLGIFEPDEEADAEILADLSGRLRERLGPDVVELLRATSLTQRIGDYLFVHAGLAPDLPLEDQGPDELLWIREPFLEARLWPHPVTVVHGHTPLGPELLPHRIGLDSGCFFTGVLTAVEIEDRRLRFHAVSSEPEPEEFRRLLEASGQSARFAGAWQHFGGAR